MPRRVALRLCRFWIAIFAVGFFCCVTGLFLWRDNSALATPHLISRADHPFDPDWPIVQHILQTKCFKCHRAGSDRYDFSTYESLMVAGRQAGMPAVVPGNADDSALWQYVCWNATAGTESKLPNVPEMPAKPSEWLTAGQLQTLRRWIDNGAFKYRIPDFCKPRRPVETDYPSAKQCASCHPRQYDQWSRSMHAYSQHSPIFEAFNLTLIERTGGTIGTFCSRCHTPIGTSLGENGSRRNVHRSRISMEGITCVVCHRRKDGRYKSNGRIRIEPGQIVDVCVYGPFDGAANVPGGHESKAFPYIKSSQFCGECHDVTSPQGVRLEEAFSEWQNSPAAKDGITCQNCHMGPVQGRPIPDAHRPLGYAAEVPGIDAKFFQLRPLSDHTFAGPDYSLMPDTEFPHKLDWMYETDYRVWSKLTPHQQKTLIDLRKRNRKSLRIADAKRYELLTNAASIEVRHPDAACANGKIRIAVDVTNHIAGHSFPTGFTAERQLWIGIEVRDPNGNVVFVSGDVDRNGDLRDSHSHGVETGNLPYDKHLLNFQNKFIALTNKGTERSVVLSVNRHLRPLNVMRPAPGIAASQGRPFIFRLARGSIPPLKTIGTTYPVPFPSLPGTYTVDVRLNFRHLPPTLLDSIGAPHLKHLLEVVVIDQYQGSIYVGQ